MITEKRVTKNKNIIIVLEDLTGSISALVKVERGEVFQKAEELQLDDVVAVKCSGNRDLLFVHEIYFPDAFVHQKVKFNEDISLAFLSDIHCGSKKHLTKSFEKFLDWLNSNDENARKIRYIFISGDNVDGVGIFPGQERLLELKSMKEQYTLLASYLNKVPKHITMFMCPGQHDATRVAEPQPIIDRKYAEPLYHIDNLILVTNPALVKLLEEENEFKVLMYHGASIHSFINEIKELRELKAHRCPAKAVKHMLKRRHLAPTHSSAVYIPNAEKDPLVIAEVPDVICTGEVHRPDIDNYNGVLIITGSCWQAQTEFEEKVGNIPDPAKLPVLNLKTRELKVFDFGIEEEIISVSKESEENLEERDLVEDELLEEKNGDQ
jgi:DNA polymerase II small subunit